MSYSSITKRAYASALRELMQETPFEKITVAQICEKNDLSRKSFYYHFRDKYDLVTWIFDEDFIRIIKKQPATTWEFMDLLCNYFYENRDFYQKVLKIEGQNSFSAHFEEVLSPLIGNRLQTIFAGENLHPICIDFITDGLLCSIKRWLLDRNCIPPDQYVSILRSLVEKIAANYSQ